MLTNFKLTLERKDDFKLILRNDNLFEKDQK